jgi:hypothetical protein
MVSGEHAAGGRPNVREAAPDVDRPVVRNRDCPDRAICDERRRRRAAARGAAGEQTAVIDVITESHRSTVFNMSHPLREEPSAHATPYVWLIL